eukprot:SAG31_NODE_596_length_13674_cov_3.806409_4_plen_76_part_00
MYHFYAGRGYFIVFLAWLVQDYLHLSSKGYTIWAQTIDRTLKTLLGEDVPPPRTQAEQNALTASTNKEKSAKATL